MPNFENFTDQQIAEHVQSQDWGETPTPEYISNLLQQVAVGRAVFERRSYGYALIYDLRAQDIPEGSGKKQKRTILELLFVDEAYRGSDVAKNFLDEIKSNHKQWPMYLVCFKAWRRDFFLKHGFKLTESPESEVFCLEYWHNAT